MTSIARIDATIHSFQTHRISLDVGPQGLFRLVFLLRGLSRLPLHVAWAVLATALERHDMIDYVTRARTGGFSRGGTGVALLEIVLSLLAPRNASPLVALDANCSVLTTVMTTLTPRGVTTLAPLNVTTTAPGSATAPRGVTTMARAGVAAMAMGGMTA